MDFLRRFMASLQTGLASAMATWREEAFTPVDEEWDSFDDRMTRYANGIVMYSNSQYKTIVNRMAPKMIVDQKLYRHIRGIYNPAYRTVEGYVSGVYGGEIKRSLRGGAIHIETENDTLRDDIHQILMWSNWQQNKSLYVRTGGTYGDVLLKVVDDIFRQQVRIEVLDPRKVLDVITDDVGNIKQIVIQFQKMDEHHRNEQEFTYTEIITKETFATFKNGAPFAFFRDINGEPRAEWENVYGFVPVNLVNHIDIGQKFGANSFHAQIAKINSINDQASILGDAVRNAVDILYHARGAIKGFGMSTNKDEPSRDDVRLLFTPENIDMIPLVAPIDIAAASAMIQDMLEEIEDDIPILALHRIRQGSNLTAPGVMSAFSDAINMIKDSQANYDLGLIHSLQMGLTIAGIRGYGGIRFTKNSFAQGELDFSIRLREVIKDSLSKIERVTLLNGLDAANPLAPLILQEMGLDTDAIEDAERRLELAREDQLMLAMAQSRATRSQDLIQQGRTIRDVRTEAAERLALDNGQRSIVG